MNEKVAEHRRSDGGHSDNDNDNDDNDDDGGGDDDDDDDDKCNSTRFTLCKHCVGMSD